MGLQKAPQALRWLENGTLKNSEVKNGPPKSAAGTEESPVQATLSRGDGFSLGRVARMWFSLALDGSDVVF